jgi:uncharacterized DUF497 family protein
MVMSKVVFTNTYKYGKVGIARFEWDPYKDLENFGKHKIYFEDAIEAFADPNGIDLRDDKHSLEEIRRYWVGKIRDGRVITVRYTDRGGRIRIIGAGEWRIYRKVYYEETKIKRSKIRHGSDDEDPSDDGEYQKD